MKLLLKSVAVVLGLACAAGAQDDEMFRVLPGFSPDLDGVCGLGTDLQAGCDAIRDRPILDAGVAPWAAVGRVNFADVVNRRHCTGTLVTPDVVLTAAHCLRFDDGKAVPVQDVTFAAGYQRGSAVAAAQAVQFVFGDDAERREPARDWALIVLGDRLDIAPLALVDGMEPGGDATLLGYTGLRAHVLSEARCGPLGLLRADLHVLLCPAMPGDSGAPIVVEQRGRMRVAAVMSSLVTLEGETATLAVPVAAVKEALQGVTAF